MARVKHPHVAVVYEVGEHKESVYIAMELVEGPTLRLWLRERKRTTAEIIEIFVAIGEGLDAAHTAGLVHRDFKPDNVLIGSDGRPRVVDFGLARPDSALEPGTDAGVDESSTSLDATLTHRGAIAGTPAYMAPEQFRGEPTDARTDQFAFCVALHEAVHGRRPFDETTFQRLRASVTGGRREPVKETTDGSVHRIDVLVDRGLATDPDARFEDMKQLLGQLAAEPSSSGPGFGRWILGGLAAVGLAGAVAYGRGDPSSVPNRPPGTDGTTQAAVPYAEALAASDLPPTVETPLADDPTGVTIHRLNNGLTVYLCPRRDVPRIHGRLVLRVGSAHDPKGFEGLAHLLAKTTEHGTARLGSVDWGKERPIRERIRAQWPKAGATEADLSAIAELEGEASALVVPHEYRDITRRLGIDVDTVVDRYSTRFEAEMPATFLESWLRLEAERVRAPVFRGVLGELRALATGEPDAERDHYDRIMAGLYPGTPFGHSPQAFGQRLIEDTIGRLETLHRQWYAPNQAALVLVGDVDPDTALPLIDRIWGDWEPTPPSPRPQLEDDDASPTGVARVPGARGLMATSSLNSYSTDGRTGESLAWRIPAPTDPEFPAFAAAASLLSDRVSGRADELGFFSSLEALDFGVASFSLLVDAERAPKAADAVLTELEGVLSDELDLESWADDQALERALAIERGDTYADELARLHAVRLSWPEHVRRQSASKLGPDEVRAALRALRERPLRVEPVPADEEASRPVRVPIPADVAGAAGPSPFATSLDQASGAAPEPQFLIEGRHYWCRGAPGGHIVAARCDRGVERVSVKLGLWGIPPAETCSTSFVAGLAFFQLIQTRDFEGRFQGRVTCQGREATLRIAGVSGSGLTRILTDPAGWFGDEEGRAALEKAREGAAEGLLSTMMGSMNQELRHVQVWQRLYTPRDTPMSEYFSATTPPSVDRIRELWSSIGDNQVRIEYCGPDVEHALEAAPLGRTRTPPPSKPEATASIEPRIVVFRSQGPAMASISIEAAPDSKAPRPSRATAAVLGRYLKDRIRGPLVSHASTESAFQIDVGSPSDGTLGPAGLLISITADAATMRRALEVVSEFVAAPKVDAAGIERAKAEVELDLRCQRTSIRDIPEVVFEWGDDRTDPRMKTWAGLSAVTPEQMQSLLGSFVGRPITAAISGPIDEVGLDFLRTLGPVEEALPE